MRILMLTLDLGMDLSIGMHMSAIRMSSTVSSTVYLHALSRSFLPPTSHVVHCSSAIPTCPTTYHHFTLPITSRLLARSLSALFAVSQGAWAAGQGAAQAWAGAAFDPSSGALPSDRLPGAARAHALRTYLRLSSGGADERARFRSFLKDLGQICSGEASLDVLLSYDDDVL